MSSPSPDSPNFHRESPTETIRLCYIATMKSDLVNFTDKEDICVYKIGKKQRTIFSTVLRMTEILLTEQMPTRACAWVFTPQKKTETRNQQCHKRKDLLAESLASPEQRP